MGLYRLFFSASAVCGISILLVSMFFIGRSPFLVLVLYLSIFLATNEKETGRLRPTTVLLEQETFAFLDAIVVITSAKNDPSSQRNKPQRA